MKNHIKHVQCLCNDQVDVEYTQGISAEEITHVRLKSEVTQVQLESEDQSSGISGNKGRSSMTDSGLAWSS